MRRAEGWRWNESHHCSYPLCFDTHCNSSTPTEIPASTTTTSKSDGGRPQSSVADCCCWRCGCRTVIAAYKISDGVEDGLKTVAEEKPEAFTESLSVLTWPLRWAVLIALLGSGYFIWRRIKKYINLCCSIFSDEELLRRSWCYKRRGSTCTHSEHRS